MTKHATEKDLSLKSQLIISASGSENSEDGCNEKLWPTGRFFRDERSEFEMKKVNYPQNNLFYMNQAYLTVQKGNAHHFILGQIIPAADVPSDVQNHDCPSEDWF